MSRKKTTFGLMFYINRQKAKNDGECLIMMRIIINGKRVALSVNRCVHPDYWDTERGMVNPKAKDSNSINVHIETMRAKGFNKHTELVNQHDNVSPEMVRDALLGVNSGTPRTLMAVWDEHIDNLKKLIGRGSSYTNHLKFATCRRYMEEYLLKEYRCSDINLKNIDRRLVKQFEIYIRTEKECGYNTTIKYLQNFKTVLLIGIRNGWMKINPFAEYKLSLKTVDRPFLDEEELQAMMDKKFHVKRLEQVRDLFVFSCYTGLSYADIKKLKKSEIEKAPNGTLWIRSKRQKTGVNANIPLLQVPLSILEKYKFQGMAENQCLLPVLSNQKTNAYLKEIADLCKIYKCLSFHIARHTFATTVTLMNGVPMESVSKMLGHSSLRSTQHYARIVDKKVGDDMMDLGKKLDGRLGMAS